MHTLTASSIAELREANLAKDFTQPAVGTAGLQFYNLDPVVKYLYPIETPFRNMLPRNAEGRGTATRWKAITGINTGKQHPGVSEGNRASAITHTTADYLATYAALGHEDFATFEAGLAAKGLIDVNAEARIMAAQALMLSEELMLIGGNATAIAAPAAPVGVGSAGTGTMAASTAHYAACVALTYWGWEVTTVAGGCLGTYVKTNMDASTDNIEGGHTELGAIGTESTGVGENTITWTVPEVREAYGYVWFTGLANAAGSLYITEITATNVYVQTAPPPGAGQLGNHANLVANHTADGLVFDGLMNQIMRAGSGAYFESFDGAAFTVDASGSVDAFDNILSYLWNQDKRRISPTAFLMNANTYVDMSKKVLGTAANHPNITINVDPGTKGISVGQYVGNYLNKWSKTNMSFVTANLQDGHVIAISNRIPYPRNGVSATMVVEQRDPYYNMVWPLVKRRREYGAYVDECLKILAPFAFGSVVNIDVT